MIIKSLELENIRSYKKQLIEFQEGINFLSGDIGSGKSTILHATEFAFFGFKRGDLEGYHLLRKGELEGNVKLTLIDQELNQEIEIFRRIKKSKSSETISQENGYIRIDDDLIELSPQELNSRIFDILNFPKEFLTKDKNLIYRFTIYTAQEQLKEILFSESERKLEVIRKLFGIDNYKKLQDAISIYLTNSRTDKKVLESKLENKDKLEEEVKELTKIVEQLEDKLRLLLEKEKPLKEKIDKCKSAIEKRTEALETILDKRLSCEKKLSLIEEIKNRTNELIDKQNQLKEEIKQIEGSDLTKIISDKNNQLSILEKKVKEFEKKRELKSKDKDKQNEIQKQKEGIQKIILELDSKKKLTETMSKDFDYILTKCRRKDTEVRVKRLEKALEKSEKLKKTLEEKKEKLAIYDHELSTLEKLVEETIANKRNMSSMKTCPTCNQDISSNLVDISKHLDSEIKKSQDRIKEIQLDKIKDKKILDTSEKTFEEVEAKEKKLLEENQTYKLLLEQESKEKVQHEELKLLKLEVEQIIASKPYDKLREIEKLLDSSNKTTDEFEKSINEENNIREEISKLKLEISNIQNKSKEKDRFQKEIEEIKDKIKANEENLKKQPILENNLKEINKKEDEFKDSRKRYQEALDQLQEKEKELSNRLASGKTELEARMRELNQRQTTQKEMQEIEIRFKKMLFAESFLSDKVHKIAQAIEKVTFTKYYAEFNEQFEMLFKDLIEDNEIDVRLDEVFSIIVEQNGYDIDIKNLSGGEKSSLAIAYRLGLKKIIENNLKSEQRLNILILDEPTDGFSNEQIDRLGLLLKESTISQILLVSHDPKIESIADTIINIEKQNHISSIS